MKQANRLLHWFVMAFMVGALAVAQEATETPEGQASTEARRLARSQDPLLGSFLTDGQGNSLYVNIGDAEGEACTASCLRYWPAFTSDQTPEAAEGIDTALITVAEGPAGERQVSYNGWPLYYYAYDRSAGDLRGEGIADVWFLISPAGEPLNLPVEVEAEETVEHIEDPETVVPPVKARSDEQEAELLKNYIADGEQIYAVNCASCHGPNGEGGVGIRLISNPLLADAHDIADAVTNGRGYMPPFGGQLSDAEIAAVLTFVRNSFENDYGILEEEVVQQVRR